MKIKISLNESSSDFAKEVEERRGDNDETMFFAGEQSSEKKVLKRVFSRCVV